MMEWYSNDGMTFKWWNDIQMMEMEWHSNDGMAFKWWNDIQMMERTSKLLLVGSVIFTISYFNEGSVPKVKEKSWKPSK